MFYMDLTKIYQILNKNLILNQNKKHHNLIK